MLNENIDIELIAKITGFDNERIKSIQKNQEIQYKKGN